ncbi:unannotated protein [freshwater metagenome]|uniref:Unannotated protein n=1 Tax=freshwater metagenome TaxID=449393 RepID=A0A6J6K449_9ZZZZ|nr:hypothetical protein [Actinomycetota bacterium]
MTSLQPFIEAAHTRAGDYSRCTPEQALVYACEDVVELEFGSREIPSTDAEALLKEICHAEDIEIPTILIARKSKSALALTYIEENVICIRGKSTTMSTLLHELAHAVVGAESHGVLFRDELARLARKYISVSYAALLHAVYSGVGLEMSPWPATAARRN